MFPRCCFCGKAPVVAWFEGPRFRTFVETRDQVRSDEAWLCCDHCLRLVEIDDRDGLFQRGAERLRQAGNPETTIDPELHDMFWRGRLRT